MIAASTSDVPAVSRRRPRMRRARGRAVMTPPPSTAPPPIAGARYRRSPGRTCPQRSVPAGISITTRAPAAIAIRHGRRSRTTFTAYPWRSTKTTSIAKRMPAVWTAAHGARIIAEASSRRSRPSRPRRRVLPRRGDLDRRWPPAGACVRSSARRSSEHSRHEVPADAPAVLPVRGVGAAGHAPPSARAGSARCPRARITDTFQTAGFATRNAACVIR